MNESGEDVIVAPKFSSTLRSIVRHVSRVAKPKEALLAILEALERFEEDGVAFGHLVDPLADIVSRLGQENSARLKIHWLKALRSSD